LEGGFVRLLTHISNTKSSEAENGYDSLVSMHVGYVALNVFHKANSLTISWNREGNQGMQQPELLLYEQ
jgi:hypothetical protein